MNDQFNQTENYYQPGNESNRPPIVINPIFVSILITSITTGFLTYYNWSGTRFWIFIFVISGWIVSLSLHEFGHAWTAFTGGDKSVADKGYLTLNPLKYTNLFMSIIIPVIFLMMGGIGFPGGAVYINMDAIRNRKHRSLVSAAGPLATGAFAFILLLPFLIGLNIGASAGQMPFWSALALLAFLQITALFLNLLPVPGLDGFGIIEPFLSYEIMIKLRKVGGLFILAIFFLLFNDTPVSRGFWMTIRYITDLLNLDISLVRDGFQLFRFWDF